MRNMRLKIGWQIDNIDSPEWTLLGADTATNTQTFGDEGDLGLGGDFDTETPAPNYGARFLTLLSAFLNYTISAMHLAESVTTYLRLALYPKVFY